MADVTVNLVVSIDPATIAFIEAVVAKLICKPKIASIQLTIGKPEPQKGTIQHG